MGSFLIVVMAAIITWLLVPLCITIAYKTHILDVPDGAIKKHKNPTPYLGGIAVGLGFLISFLLGVSHPPLLVIAILIGSYAMLLLGLLDDIYRITYYQKFLGQLIVASWLVYHGVAITPDLFFGSAFGAAIISVLWLLTLMNAFNLVDVMDGLATTIALGCALSMTIIVQSMGYESNAYLLLLFSATLLGFLWYNVPPASIYLGDAGALFIGCMLASISLIVPWDTVPHGWVIPCILFAIPLLEVVSLVVIRSYRGIPFYKASADHFCLYLKRRGWSIPGILSYITFINSILLGTALLFLYGYVTVIHIFMLAFIYFLIWLFVLIKF